jgi:fluoride exporter
MWRLFWISVGGAVGTGARYLLSGWVLGVFGTQFPYGTLAVNVIGSFLLGGMMQFSLTTGVVPPTLRLALTTGMLGGFTTYSTFNYESVRYLQEGAWAIGILNIAITLCSCLAAGVAGLFVARWLAA